jgi:hypothetical protein
MKPRRGRPPLDPDGPSVSVHLRLLSKDYDALFARAREQRVTVPQTIRRVLAANIGTQYRRPS